MEVQFHLENIYFCNFSISFDPDPFIQEHKKQSKTKIVKTSIKIAERTGFESGLVKQFTKMYCPKLCLLTTVIKFCLKPEGKIIIKNGK